MQRLCTYFLSTYLRLESQLNFPTEAGKSVLKMWKELLWKIEQWTIHEPRYDKTNKVTVRPAKIRVFAVRMKKAWVLSYPLSAQRRLWSGWADAQADLSLCWAHSHFVGFCHFVAHMDQTDSWHERSAWLQNNASQFLKWASSWDYGTFRPP